MKRTGTVIAGMLAVLVAGTLDRPIKAGQDKSAEVMANTRKAIGGAKLEQLKTFSAQARMQRNIGNMQMTSDTEVLLEMPDRYVRSETSSSGGAGFTMGFNGDTLLSRTNVPMVAGGAVIRMVGPGGAAGGPGEALTPERQAELNAVALRGARQDISRLMLGWFGMTHPSLDAQYSYAGEAESPDGHAHVIDVKSADGFAVRLFIDQDTNLPLMATYQAPQPRMATRTAGGGGTVVRRAGEQMSANERDKMMEDIKKMQSEPPVMVEHALFFGDWRDVDGLKFPHSMQRAVAGTTNEEWTFSRVRVNPKIDAKQFEPEKEKK